MSHSIRLRTVCVTVAILFASATAIAAQERIETSVLPAVFRPVDSRPALSRPSVAPRPSALIPLYVSFGALQALDLHSTQRALDRGGREANPVMGTVVGSPVAMTALKIGATTGIVLMSERLWKRNRVAAIVMMVSLNSAYAVVAAHNYSIAR